MIGSTSYLFILFFVANVFATNQIQGTEILDHDLEERRSEQPLSEDEEFDEESELLLSEPEEELETLYPATESSEEFSDSTPLRDLVPEIPTSEDLAAEELADGETSATHQELKAMQKKEAPYPGASSEEFLLPGADSMATSSNAPLPQNQGMGWVIKETENGSQKIQHPQANKGLVRILEDGTYIYDESRNKATPSHQFRNKGIESVSEDGTYEYAASKTEALKNHPFTSKGLLEQRDGVYRYKVEESVREGTFTFRFGTSTTPNFSRTIGDTTIDFQKIYKSSNLVQISFNQERPLFGSQSLKLSTGVGFITAQGQGVFAATPDIEAPEKYDLYIIPITADVLYRAQVYSSQKFLPFFGGGIGVSAIYERRDDEKRPGINAVPIIHGVGGIGFNMDMFDLNRMNRLDATAGINDIYITLEAHINQALDKKLDFSTQSLALGFIIDY